jgi:hypothetical protein
MIYVIHVYHVPLARVRKISRNGREAAREKMLYVIHVHHLLLAPRRRRFPAAVILIPKLYLGMETLVPEASLRAA